MENGEEAVAIDTVSNKISARVPIGQTTQALVYVPNAVPTGSGTDNLAALGEAGNTARVHLEAGGTGPPDAQASVAVNSLGLLDLVQIATEGLAPNTQYRVYLAESAHAPVGTLEPLAVLKTNPDGAGIVQAIGPLKTIVGAAAISAPPRRFLIVTEAQDSSHVVLRQSIRGHSLDFDPRGVERGSCGALCRSVAPTTVGAWIRSPRVSVHWGL